MAVTQRFRVTRCSIDTRLSRTIADCGVLRSKAGIIPAGTYLTSQKDTRFAESGLGAVARYALPNPTPAIFRFAIGLPTGTVLMCGTASPSFGQSGGGVELRTDEAIRHAHVYDPEILPEW